MGGQLGQSDDSEGIGSRTLFQLGRLPIRETLNPKAKKAPKPSCSRGKMLALRSPRSFTSDLRFSGGRSSLQSLPVAHKAHVSLIILTTAEHIVIAKIGAPCVIRISDAWR